MEHMQCSGSLLFPKVCNGLCTGRCGSGTAIGRVKANDQDIGEMHSRHMTSLTEMEQHSFEITSDAQAQDGIIRLEKGKLRKVLLIFRILRFSFEM